MRLLQDGEGAITFAFLLIPAYEQCCYRAEIWAREPYCPADLSELVLDCTEVSDRESRLVFQHDFFRNLHSHRLEISEVC